MYWVINKIKKESRIILQETGKEATAEELAKKLETEGYAGLRDELGLSVQLTDEDVNSYFVED